ncbi:putative mucin/carbohydrate-binding domain-containing protein [Pseudomonas fluorescens]|uniref:putative mucin/carbohydrate-binding domain-containing protein n=1 Tax=Pseudomonas fluorescens TaxID=294 RepID=UPI0021ABC73C|nr:putative mucin/carbohydrate-binding domain-containing protein [Pseudomonas fluorescens]
MGRLLVDVVNQSPHSYFPGQVYGEVVVRDAQGDRVFSREMLGDKTDLFSGVVLVEPGFTVEIMHKEPSRIGVSNATVSAVIDSNAQVNRLEVTEQGLVNISLGTDAVANLKVEIDKSAGGFELAPHLVLNNEYPLKQDLRRAINTLAEPLRSQLFERYRRVEFVRPQESRFIFGYDFTWYWQGNGGRALGCINLNIVTRTIDIDFYGVPPHEYFPSVYLSVLVKSEQGEVIYLRELRGNVPAQPSHVQLSFVPGSELSVMHREASRSWIVTNATGTVTSVGQVQHAQIGGMVGLKLSSYWPMATMSPDTGDLQV